MFGFGKKKEDSVKSQSNSELQAPPSLDNLETSSTLNDTQIEKQTPQDETMSEMNLPDLELPDLGSLEPIQADSNSNSDGDLPGFAQDEEPNQIENQYEQIQTETEEVPQQYQPVEPDMPDIDELLAQVENKSVPQKTENKIQDDDELLNQELDDVPKPSLSVNTTSLTKSRFDKDFAYFEMHEFQELLTDIANVKKEINDVHTYFPSIHEIKNQVEESLTNYHKEMNQALETTKLIEKKLFEVNL